MSRTDEEFERALFNRKIPILTLDNKWYQLFTESERTPDMKYMADELNDLIRRQGKVSDENREIRKLKKKLMDEIVVVADELVRDPSSKNLAKRQDECKRLLEECNEKLDANEEEMLELPRKVNKLNKRLMIATMEVCYRRLQIDTEELEEIEAWINKIRRELKKKIIRKQEKEAKVHKLYSFMHDIFGPDVLEVFDMQYDPEERYQKAKEAREAKKAKEAEKRSGEPTAGRAMNGKDASKS